MENNDNINEAASEVRDLSGAEPIEIAKELVHVLDMKKARDIKLLHVEDQTVLADYFVICQGTSNTNIKALAGEAEYKLGLCGVTPLHIDGYSEGNWIVLDFGSVLVHIMSRNDREFYKLEKLWSDSEVVDIEDILVK
ncbi:MAG: ribosome silencing factor [Clostridiales bacterium]|nr:ribosome silencing factor [Clostridiales bacterium]